MAESNPLVATASPNLTPSLTYQDGPSKGQFNYDALSKNTEGTGLFSAAASTISDIHGGNWGGVAVDVVGDGMSALGMAIDPFGTLVGAGLGWLIEHISFLKEPLDLLAGDPEQVTAKAQTWQNVAKALTDSANQYRQSAGALQGANQGAAIDGAHATGNNLATVLEGAAKHATDAGEAMKTAATIVGTTRGIIRDSLTQFLGDAIVKWVAATALAFFTFGATEAAFIVDEVAEGASLAAEDASKISKVVQALAKLKGGAKDSEGALKNATQDIAKDAKQAGKVGHDAPAADAAARDAGKTKPNAGEGTTPSAAGAGGAPHVREPGAAPKDTGAPTTPAAAPHETAAAHSGEPTAPRDAGGGATAPSSAGGGGAAPHVTERGAAPKDAGGGATTPSAAPHETPAARPTEPTAPRDAGGGTAPSSAGGAAAPHVTERGAAPKDAGAESTTASSAGETGAAKSGGKAEPPSHEEVQQHVADHKQAVAEHNQRVDAHNQQAEDLRAKTEQHNQKAVENQQRRAENDHARKANEQAINRARNEGRSHADLKAEHQRLEAEHKSLRQEDAELGRSQRELTGRQHELHKEGADLTAQAKDLKSQRWDVAKERAGDLSRQGGLENARFDGNKFVQGLVKAHEAWEGPIPHVSLGDTLKEPFAQALSDQGTRDSTVSYESGVKQEEWAKEHGGGEPAAGQPAPAGGQAPSGEPAGQPAWPTEHPR